MSKSFYVSNRSLDRSLTIKECLDLFEDLEVYDLGDDIDISKAYINDFEQIILGKLNLTARGFSLAYNDNKYEFNILNPASIYDYKIMLLAIYKLADFLNTKEISDETNIYTISEFLNYDYKSDILYGLNEIDRHLTVEHQYLMLPCLTVDVAIDRFTIDELFKLDDPVVAFSNYITNLENLDAYYAKATYYKQDEGIIGVYTLTEGVRTVLPRRPSINSEYKDVINEDNFLGFKIALVLCNGDKDNRDSYEMEGIIDYETLFTYLKEYEMLDAINALVEPLSHNDMLNLIKED